MDADMFWEEDPELALAVRAGERIILVGDGVCKVVCTLPDGSLVKEKDTDDVYFRKKEEGVEYEDPVFPWFTNEEEQEEREEQWRVGSAVWDGGIIVSVPLARKIFFLKEDMEEAEVFAGSGEEAEKDGVGAKAEFTGPSGMQLDGNGNLVVLDGHAVRSIDLHSRAVMTLFTLTEALGEEKAEKVAPGSIGYCSEGHILLVLEEETERGQCVFVMVTLSMTGTVLHETARMEEHVEDNVCVWPHSIVMDENGQVAYLLGNEASSGGDSGSNVVYAVPPLSQGVYMGDVKSNTPDGHGFHFFSDGMVLVPGGKQLMLHTANLFILKDTLRSNAAKGAAVGGARTVNG